MSEQILNKLIFILQFSGFFSLTMFELKSSSVFGQGANNHRCYNGCHILFQNPVISILCLNFTALIQDERWLLHNNDVWVNLITLYWNLSQPSGKVTRLSFQLAATPSHSSSSSLKGCHPHLKESMDMFVIRSKGQLTSHGSLTTQLREHSQSFVFLIWIGSPLPQWVINKSIKINQSQSCTNC